MTSQKSHDQKVQDDSYTNHDDKSHSGPIRSPDKQPGPKEEKKLPRDSQPQEEIKQSNAPTGDSMLPEKSVSE